MVAIVHDLDRIIMTWTLFHQRPPLFSFCSDHLALSDETASEFPRLCEAESRRRATHMPPKRRMLPSRCIWQTFQCDQASRHDSLSIKHHEFTSKGLIFVVFCIADQSFTPSGRPPIYAMGMITFFRLRILSVFL